MSELSVQHRRAAEHYRQAAAHFDEAAQHFERDDEDYAKAAIAEAMMHIREAAAVLAPDSSAGQAAGV